MTCGNILGRSFELLSELQPDGYLVLGDTNSCLSAILQKDYIFLCFIWKPVIVVKMSVFQKKQNRRIVDVISDVNLCYSEFARKYLADTGASKRENIYDRFSYGRSASHESGKDSEERCFGQTWT